MQINEVYDCDANLIERVVLVDGEVTEEWRTDDPGLLALIADPVAIKDAG